MLSFKSRFLMAALNQQAQARAQATMAATSPYAAAAAASPAAAAAAASLSSSMASSSSGALGSSRPSSAPSPPLVNPFVEYESLGIIGRGKYSEVHKARSRSTGEVVAVKKVQIFEMDSLGRKECINEANILQVTQLSHRQTRANEYKRRQEEEEEEEGERTPQAHSGHWLGSSPEKVPSDFGSLTVVASVSPLSRSGVCRMCVSRFRLILTSSSTSTRTCTRTTCT